MSNNLKSFCLIWIVSDTQKTLLEFSSLYHQRAFHLELQEGPPGHWGGSLHPDLSVRDCPGGYVGVYVAGARDAGDCFCCSHSWREVSPALAVWL